MKHNIANEKIKISANYVRAKTKINFIIEKSLGKEFLGLIKTLHMRHVLKKF